MKMTNDLDLLRQFARENSQDAFTALVNRHVNLVYSVALRQVRSSPLAEEISQSVFSDLARNAVKLRPDTVLTAWLYSVARRTAIDTIRKESRRQLREQIAVEMNDMNATSADWTQIEPLLDDAMATLDETDRAAILLRYFENKNLREVGESLKISDDAAQKRVSRAVEQLREFFTKQKISFGASGLIVLISTNAVQAAPIGLASTISAATILAGTAVSTSTIITTTKTIAMTIIQKTLITATLAVVAGAGIYKAYQAAQLQNQIQALQQQQSPLTGQLAKLQTENERLSNQVAEAKDSQALSKAQFNELLKLRGNIGVAQTYSREVAQLKSTLAQQTGKMPDYLTNAMASGLAMSEKFKLKDAQARLGRMKKMLNLADDEAHAIGDIMQKHIQSRDQMLMASMSGNKLTPEQLQAMAGAEDDVTEIKALLTPEQLAAYPDYQQEEKATAADNSAKGEASTIADDFSLSPEQQEQIHAALYQMNLNAPDNLNQAVISAALKNGQTPDIVNMLTESQKLQLEEKLKILGNILTQKQINTYRTEQMDRINMVANSTKMFLPQKTARTAN